jgi:hypothetical protein
MKIIGIVPVRFGENEIILQAKPDEVRRIIGKQFRSDFPTESMQPGLDIDVAAISDRNRDVNDQVEKLKSLPQTLRALADILTREVTVLHEPEKSP